MTKLSGQHVIRRLQTTASATLTSASDKILTNEDAVTIQAPFPITDVKVGGHRRSQGMQ